MSVPEVTKSQIMSRLFREVTNLLKLKVSNKVDNRSNLGMKHNPEFKMSKEKKILWLTVSCLAHIADRQTNSGTTIVELKVIINKTILNTLSGQKDYEPTHRNNNNKYRKDTKIEEP